MWHSLLYLSLKGTLIQKVCCGGPSYKIISKFENHCFGVSAFSCESDFPFCQQIIHLFSPFMKRIVVVVVYFGITVHSNTQYIPIMHSVYTKPRLHCIVILYSLAFLDHICLFNRIICASLFTLFMLVHINSVIVLCYIKALSLFIFFLALGSYLILDVSWY